MSHPAIVYENDNIIYVGNLEDKEIQPIVQNRKFNLEFTPSMIFVYLLEDETSNRT